MQAHHEPELRSSSSPDLPSSRCRERHSSLTFFRLQSRDCRKVRHVRGRKAATGNKLGSWPRCSCFRAIFRGVWWWFIPRARTLLPVPHDSGPSSVDSIARWALLFCGLDQDWRCGPDYPGRNQRARWLARLDKTLGLRPNEKEEAGGRWGRSGDVVHRWAGPSAGQHGSALRCPRVWVRGHWTDGNADGESTDLEPSAEEVIRVWLPWSCGRGKNVDQS